MINYNELDDILVSGQNQVVEGVTSVGDEGAQTTLDLTETNVLLMVILIFISINTVHGLLRDVFK